MKRIAIISGLVSIFFLASVFTGRPEAQQAGAAPAAASAPATAPSAPPVMPLGYDTTRIMSPLTADGTVDYVAALNEKYSKGVTKENNAAVILVEAFDPEKFFAKGTSQEMLDALGAAKPEESGYFKDFFVDGKAVAPGSEKFYENAQIEPWKSDDNPEVAQWLKGNDAPLEKIVEASKLTRFFIPTIGPGPANAQVAACRELLHAARALMVRANMAIGDGKFADAWRDITTVYRLGALYGQGPQLIDRMAGLGLIRMSLKTAETFANFDKIPRGQAKSRLGSFLSAQFPAVPDAISSIDTGERYLTLLNLGTKGHTPSEQTPETAKMALGLLGLDKVPAEFYLRVWKAIPDSSVPDMARQINDTSDEMVKTMSLPTYGQQAAEFKKLSDEAERLKKELVRSKYFDSDDPVLLTQWAGHYLRLSMIYWYPNAQLASYRAATQKKLVTIALAMAAYKSDKGKYPGSLSELAAEATIGTGKTAIKAYPYILTTKTMPVDFFSDKSDKPFMYKTEGNGYTLYSVGENMKDDAGKGDDIVIQKM